jgi:hypothetical protein
VAQVARIRRLAWGLGTTGGQSRTPTTKKYSTHTGQRVAKLCLWISTAIESTRTKVKFVERFLNAGHTLSWIPRDRDSRKSTHDFMWLNHGPYEIELKSTKAKYSTIRGQIMGAVKRAKVNHNVTKSRFIIDLGDQPLTAELREELTHYNLDRSLYKIKALWVMTQGELEQINLRKK